MRRTLIISPHLWFERTHDTSSSIVLRAVDPCVGVGGTSTPPPLTNLKSARGLESRKKMYVKKLLKFESSYFRPTRQSNKLKIIRQSYYLLQYSHLMIKQQSQWLTNSKSIFLCDNLCSSYYFPFDGFEVLF